MKKAALFSRRLALRSRARSARRTCLGGDESGPIKPDRYNENGAPENGRPELR